MHMNTEIEIEGQEAPHKNQLKKKVSRAYLQGVPHTGWEEQSYKPEPDEEIWLFP